MINRSFILVSCFLVFFIQENNCHAQIDDVGVWTGFTVDHKFTRSLSAGVTQQLRLYKDVTRTDQYLSQLSLSYNLTKNFKAALAYRYSYKDREGYFSNRHRIMFDLAYRYKYKKITLTLRERIQRQVMAIHSSELGYLPEWHWRSRLAVRYNMEKKYTPYVSAEIYYLIQNPKRDVSQIDRIRYEAGVDYEFNRNHSINPFLLFQYGLPDKVNRFVYGISYTISI